jgi:hypothetical protein
MKRISKVFSVFLVFLALFVVSRHVLAQMSSEEEVGVEEQQAEGVEEDYSKFDSYDVFWPIVAGKTMGDKLFSLKMMKERVREMLIFSSFRKADYNITLSEKRLVEAEKLYLEKSDYKNAQKSVEESHRKAEKAYGLIKKAEGEGRYVVDLKNAMKQSFAKKKRLVKYLIIKVPEDQKKYLEDYVSKIDSAVGGMELES